jgi:hypothetical protein
LKATLKSGTGYDAPWLTVDADTPAELEQRLRGIIDSKVLETVAEAAGIFRATQLTTAQAPAQQGQPEWSQPAQQQAPPQQGQGWGAAQQQSAPQGGGGSKFGGPPHPEGKTCDICPKVLEMKKTSTGKGTWRCPDWRWNNGTPNGHTSEWAN